MSRALPILLFVSVVLTAVTIWSNLVVRTTVGPAHFWSDLAWSAAIASWLVVAMLWCTKQVVESNRNGWKQLGKKVDRLESHLREVEDTVSDIDKERVRANAAVVHLFRNRQAR